MYLLYMGNTRKNKKKNNKTIGGKVIASGGYGCVFSPALLCKGSVKRTHNHISKLMTTKHANEEHQLINHIQQQLNSIPNYKDYFLIYNTDVCVPAKLTKSDLSHFKKCTALKKDNITQHTINDKLDTVLALNLPYGGLPVDDFIYNNGNYNNLYKIHNALVHLLKNGILPMNKKHIYHSDIKDSNILIDNVFKARLIDWGLSVQYTPSLSSSFPKNWLNRPLQFNVPFSIIIFTDIFYDKYTKYLLEGGKIEIHELKIFALDYLVFWNNKRGYGHYKFINEIVYLLNHYKIKDVPENKKPLIIETEFTIPYIVNYITQALLHYTRFKEDGTLNLREYLNKVFIKHIDIWGFITSYFPMIEIFSNNYDTLNTHELKTFDYLSTMFNTYLYEPIPTQQDPCDTLMDDLHTLGNLIKQCNIHIAGSNKSSSHHSIFKKKKLKKHFQHPFLSTLVQNNKQI